MGAAVGVISGYDHLSWLGCAAQDHSVLLRLSKDGNVQGAVRGIGMEVAAD